jgi:hypothetical protein
MPGAALAQPDMTVRRTATSPQPTQLVPPRMPPVSALPGDAALLAQPCAGLFSLPKAYAHARKWIDSWNSTSVDTVMALYTPDFEFRARGIIINPNVSSPSGVLRGQADNRMRWFGVNTDKNPGTFRLVGAFAGVRSVVVYYLNGGSEPVAEVSEYRADCKIERSNALYGPHPVGNGLQEPAYINGTTGTGSVVGQ